MLRNSFAILLSLAAPAMAKDISFSLPINCSLGETCYIQNYVDLDPSDGARDHSCSTATYDGHKGTDFALNDLDFLSQQVEVLAARAGVVIGTRDSMPDIAINAPNAPELKGKDCGNGVSIRHEDGWESQYCHMARGSIAVETGDEVQAGAPLGYVGLSGNTEFPHLHLSLRNNSQVVDPFSPNPSADCAANPSLWDPDVSANHGNIISFGVTDFIPEYEDILSGLPEIAALNQTSPAMVSWLFLHNVRAGDIVSFSTRVDDKVVFSREITLEKNQARIYRATGTRRPAGVSEWPEGRYTAMMSLTRDGEIFDQRQTSFSLNP